MKDTAGEEERLLLFSRKELDPEIDGHGIVIVFFRFGEGAPIDFLRVQLDSAKRKVLRKRGGRRVRVEPGRGARPGVVVENDSLIQVPLARGVVARGVVKDFPGTHGLIAMFSEVLRQSVEVGQVRLDPLLVAVDPGRGRQPATHDGGPAWATHGSRGVGIGEGGAFGGQAVKVRCVFLAGVPVEKSNPVVHVVDRHEQYVGRRPCQFGQGEQSRDETVSRLHLKFSFSRAWVNRALASRASLSLGSPVIAFFSAGSFSTSWNLPLT